jgi:hypothetical protein
MHVRWRIFDHRTSIVTTGGLWHPCVLIHMEDKAYSFMAVANMHAQYHPQRNTGVC